MFPLVLKMLLYCILLFMVCYVLNALRIAVSAILHKPIGIYKKEIESRRDYCFIESLSKEFLWTVVRFEDPNYCNHHGFDVINILRAVKHNLRTRAKRNSMRGGSSITQQLAKNLYLYPNRTFTRKLAELFIAIYLEWKLDKAKIIELYCNIVYCGKKLYGVGPASSFYFNSKPACLSLNQSFSLVCTFPCPDRYNPIDDQDLFQKARAFSVYRLVGRNVIKKELFEQIMQTPWNALANEIHVDNMEESLRFLNKGKNRSANT